MRAIMLHVKSTYSLKWMNLRLIVITIAILAFIVNLAKANTVEPSYLFGEKIGNSLVINLDAVEISEYEIEINGEAYKGDVTPLEHKTVHVFNMNELRNTAFFVNELSINGKAFTGKFNSILELIDCLNEKTNQQWNWDEARGIVFGGENTACSNMLITAADDIGQMLEFPVSEAEIAKNVAITLPEGNNTVTLNNFVTGFKAKKEFFETIASNE